MGARQWRLGVNLGLMVKGIKGLKGSKGSKGFTGFQGFKGFEGFQMGLKRGRKVV